VAAPEPYAGLGDRGAAILGRAAGGGGNDWAVPVELEPTARVLIVDDRPENILAVQSILDGPEFELLTARSGPEALGQLLTADVALILLDVLMPGMDGFETARLIRAREACRHIPIIFLTAAGSDLHMVERGYAVGAVDYLVKPLNPEVVKAKVAVFVDLARKNQQLRRREHELRLAERARNDEVLREREALYEASFDCAAVGITHVATDGRWLRVNPQFCKLTGYSAEEACRLRVQDVVHPEDAAEQIDGLGRVARGELESFRREARYLRKDGSMVWVDCTVSPLRDRSGSVRYFVAVLEDITTRRDGEKRERLVAEVSQVLLSSFDHRRELDVLAKVIAGALGDWCVIGLSYPDDMAQPTAASAVACLEPARDELASRLRASLESSTAYARWLTDPQSVTPANGAQDLARSWGLDPNLARELGVLSAVSVPLWARGRAFGHVTVLLAREPGAGDVTTIHEVARRIALALDNGELYRQTQAAVRARDEFLSIASHELRTPLTPLRIHLQRLLSPKAGAAPVSQPGRMQTVLHRCERKVRRLEALVDTLFDVSRLNQRPLRLQLALVDLGELARKVIDSFAEETAAAGCEVTLDVEGDVSGRWDRCRLEQVVSHVIENAIKFGPGRPIDIAIEGTGERVRMIVRDHGVGIERSQLEEIFERFHPIVSSPNHSGLRLGLSITRQIVEAHHGWIKADSEAGAGAWFTIELPREIQSPRADDIRAGGLIGLSPSAQKSAPADGRERPAPGRAPRRGHG